ncbi:MAG TPA: alpha/beta hydrolase [Ureibacillus sp.]|nr:alpha/beta hydrolase [Ureibacillus sp.]
MENTKNQHRKMTTDVIIEKTIFASVMDNGFWHRWMVHGIDDDFILNSKSKMITLNGWIEALSNRALEHLNLATRLRESSDLRTAEFHYRKAGIYYNLVQWVFPEPSGSRTKWYKLCMEQFRLADSISEDKISHYTITIRDKNYGGRVRVPKGKLSGVVILVIPTDSTKEEFYLYEKDFAREGFAVISFDGAGQGETLLIHGHKADIESWDQFTKGIIDFASANFPGLPINLFGTSSGGCWAIEASRSSLVSKTAVVSPPPKFISNIRLPDYFRERMSNMLVDFDKGCLPVFDNVEEIGNILMFHGGKDLFVNEAELIELYKRFAPEKRFITYEEEGHCCNFKLREIRLRASEWFRGEDINGV